MSQKTHVERFASFRSGGRLQEEENLRKELSEPMPKDRGRLTAELHCGPCVAKLYEHDSHPQLTVVFERERSAGEKINASAHFLEGDLRNLRKLSRLVEDYKRRSFREQMERDRQSALGGEGQSR